MCVYFAFFLETGFLVCSHWSSLEMSTDAGQTDEELTAVPPLLAS